MIVESFLSGAICMGFFAISLFFLRFWRETRDRLFLYFAAAFSLMLADRLLRISFEINPDWQPAVYLLRLVGFLLLLMAILEKNRRP
jgi:hypothetical protein